MVKILPVIRILFGLFFAAVGLSKLLTPYQNFLYVIEHYQFLPRFLEILSARAVPWVEFFLGIFLCLGLWTFWALRGLMVLSGAFIVIISQALIRGLPIDECGCFGEWISVPPQVMMIIDSLILLVTIVMISRLQAVMNWSLDKYYEK